MYRYDIYNECSNDNDYIEFLEMQLNLYEMQLNDLRETLFKHIKKIGD